MQWLEWYKEWATTRQHERIGQAFCNDFIKKPWPELFYEEDHQKAILTIWQWVRDNCYSLDRMPAKHQTKGHS